MNFDFNKKYYSGFGSNYNDPNIPINFINWYYLRPRLEKIKSHFSYLNGLKIFRYRVWFRFFYHYAQKIIYNHMD